MLRSPAFAKLILSGDKTFQCSKQFLSQISALTEILHVELAAIWVGRVNSHAELIVADTGQGIDPASLQLVFDRFWQADNRGQGKFGVGLGLSIVKEIVGLHDGTVSAHSEGPGRGSTFTIRLPLPVNTVASLELRRHPTVAPTASAASAPRLDGFSIL